MSGALLELMEPVIQREVQKAKSQGISQGINQGIGQGIRGTICVLRDIGIDDQEIKRRIMAQYHLSDDAAEDYMKPEQ